MGQHFDAPARHTAAHTAIIGSCHVGVAMVKRTGSSWWSSLRLGRRAADDGDDFGDMGTAFGLEASLCSAADLDALKHGGRLEAEAPAGHVDRLSRPSTY